MSRHEPSVVTRFLRSKAAEDVKVFLADLAVSKEVSATCQKDPLVPLAYPFGPASG